MNTLSRIISYSRPYWKQLTTSLITASFFGIVSAIPAYLLKQTVDEIFIKKFSYLVVPFIFCFILIFTLKALFMYLTSYYMNWVGTRVVNDIRYDLFSKIMNLPLSFYQHTTTGQLLSHFFNDIQMIQQGTSVIIKDGIRSFFEASFLIFFAFFQNWKLALLLMTVGPIIGFVIQKMGRARKNASAAIQKQMGGISSMLQQALIGIREIKAFNAEKIETRRFKDYLKICFTSIMHNVHIEASAPALVEVIAISGGSIVFYFAVQQVLAGILTAGQLTAIIASILLSYQPLKKIVSVYSDTQYSLAAAERVFDVIDQETSTIEDRPLQINSIKNSIIFENLSFSYGQKLILNNVSLKISCGQSVGIVGPSGAGKSTLCDLLLGFITPSDGKISIDGQDIANVSLASLRQNIGYVSQRTFLFNDTILNNVLYSCPEATIDHVIDACKAAHAHEFIEQLSSGYQTMVGENGTLLSGGQKQRITIARALLKNPDLLIFDEATSALDQESETMIRQTIDSLAGKKTLFIVSHRPSMLENVDRILMVDQGKIEETTHSAINKNLKESLMFLN